MLHSTQTTKKHTGNLILRFGTAGLLAAGLFFSAPYSAAAETVPSAENTDAGEITIHFTHYDAQDLEFYLNGLKIKPGSRHQTAFHMVRRTDKQKFCLGIFFS